MTRTHVIIDGLSDPLLAQQLGAAWARAGFDNAVDISAQTAWLAPAAAGKADVLTEADVDRAAGIARAFGIELRDRVGKTFKADNDPAALRAQVAKEYKARLAVTVMFGLPAIVLHYLAPALVGGVPDARGMLQPWLIEMLLVGWLCIAAAWPVLWQGALALRNLRATPDLLVSVLIAAVYLPCAIGVVLLPFRGEVWFGTPQAGGGPAFHAVAMLIALVSFSRWMMLRNADRLSGRADWMLPRISRFVFAWIVFAAVVAFTQGWIAGVMIGMLMPVALSHGGINRLSPGWSIALPVIAFAVFVLMAPDAIGLKVRGSEVEIAAGFHLLMTCVFVASWRALPRRAD